MENFNFYNSTKILFGKGQIANIGAEIPRNSKILLVYGGGSVKTNGVYKKVRDALIEHEVVDFCGIEPNPCLETLLKAVELAQRECVTFLLAVGGGSVIDATKFIAAAVPFADNPWKIMSNDVQITSALPIGTVLTLSATGSEMNPFFVITKKFTQEKLGGMSTLVFPRFSVLDPEATFSLPRRQISNGVVDAFSHTLEQYLTYPANAPLQDRMAESILSTLIEEGPKTIESPYDYEARANVMWCATMALNGLIGSGVPQDWASHKISHELTAMYEIDHARAVAIIMPSLLAFKRDTKRKKLLQFACRIWDITPGDEEDSITKAISKTRDFFELSGLPTHLSDYQIGKDGVSEIVGRLKDRGKVAWGEHQDIGLEAVETILSLCL